MEFERKFAQWQGSKYAVSASSGTAALHIALSTLGIEPGDEVIVPSYTFIASSFSIVQAGAIPRFADVNIDDHCISVESAEKLVNERTRAIMPEVLMKIGVTGFEPATSCSQSRRSGQAELHPDNPRIVSEKADNPHQSTYSTQSASILQ